MPHKAPIDCAALLDQLIAEDERQRQRDGWRQMVKAAASRTTYPSSTLEATRHGGARPRLRPGRRTCLGGAFAGRILAARLLRTGLTTPPRHPVARHVRAAAVPLAVLADAVHRPARRQAPAPLRPATRLLPLCAGRWCTRPADIGSRAVYCVQGRHMEWKLECPLQSAQGLE